MGIFWLAMGGLVAALIWGRGKAVELGGRAVSSARRLLGFSTDSLQAPAPNEDAQILAVADEYGVDPRFLASIRLAENGREGREYGVLSVPAPTYSAQLRVAAQSVKNSMARFQEDFGIPPIDDSGRLSEE